MSIYFNVGDLTLWNPSNRAGYLFVRTGEAIGPLVDAPSGIAPGKASEYELDIEAFAGFTDALVAQYLSSSHAILRSLVEGFAATAIVLVERAGRTVPALENAGALDPRDISVGRAGIAPLGDADRLRRLAGELSLAMPD